jgi:hypothetical protein
MDHLLAQLGHELVRVELGDLLRSQAGASGRGHAASITIAGWPADVAIALDAT